MFEDSWKLLWWEKKKKLKILGPGWCGGKYHGEPCKKPNDPITNCRTNVNPKDGLDSCCQIHDRCCIAARRVRGYPENSNAVNCDKRLYECTKKFNCKFGTNCAPKTGILAFFGQRLIRRSKRGC